MKGVVGEVINGIGALLIVLVILVLALSGVANVFADKRGETALAIMGVRNTIVQISLTESGIAIYETPGKENYTLEIDGTDIYVQYSGDAPTLSYMRPKLKMSHYTPDLKPAVIEGARFCIMTKKDPAKACKQFVDVCLEGAACCTAASEKSVC